MQEIPHGMRIHFVGIGGSGLSAIARVLHGWGYRVTGSDQVRSANSDALLAEGIAVRLGHSVENLHDLTGAEESAGSLVVVSSAVPDDNAEVAEAHRLGLPVVRRRELLGALTGRKTTIAVAGTHGKTTTTAMIAWILVEAGLDPSFVVGGILQNMGTNARAGSGSLFAIEADEYGHAFLGLWPQVSVVTSLEHDHPDCYPAFSDMQDAFEEFAAHTLARGQLFACAEDPYAVKLAERAAARSLPHVEPRPGSERLLPGAGSVSTYGFSPSCTWQAEDVRLNGCPAFVVRAHGRRLGQCALQLPGRHNVLNALAAIAATSAVGVEFDVAAACLTRFRGTARRFEVKGHIGGITVVDDYAHHPTAIRATLAAARSKYPGRDVWAVFQPHTYSRTLALLDEFAESFGEANHVLVTAIYAAREHDTGEVSGADVVSRMKAKGIVLPDAHYVESLGEASDWLLQRIGPGAVVITLGAGDGCRVGELLLDHLREQSAPGRTAEGAGLAGPLCGSQQCSGQRQR